MDWLIMAGVACFALIVGVVIGVLIYATVSNHFDRYE